LGPFSWGLGHGRRLERRVPDRRSELHIEVSINGLSGSLGRTLPLLGFFAQFMFVKAGL
jgi:hypothetical protein